MKAIKTLLIILFLSTASAVFAQQHYSFPVKELDSTGLDTSFKHHPTRLDIDIVEWHLIGVTDTTQRYIVCRVKTTYEDIANVGPYIYKRTITESMVRLPVTSDLLTSFDQHGVMNDDNLDKVLVYFKLKVDRDITTE